MQILKLNFFLYFDIYFQISYFVRGSPILYSNIKLDDANFTIFYEKIFHAISLKYQSWIVIFTIRILYFVDESFICYLSIEYRFKFDFLIIEGANSKYIIFILIFWISHSDNESFISFLSIKFQNWFNSPTPDGTKSKYRTSQFMMGKLFTRISPCRCMLQQLFKRGR